MAMNRTLTLLYYYKFKRMYDSLSEEERDWYMQLLNRPPLSAEEQKKQVEEIISKIEERKQNNEAS